MSAQTTTQTPEIAAGSYEIDRAHSSAAFEVEHGGISTFKGRFNEVDARLEAGDDGFVITGVAQVESIDIDDETIRPHLLSPEFFDAERHPHVKFRSTALELAGDGVRVTGELEIAGKERTVEARGRVRGPIEVPGAGTKLAVALEAEIDRTEYGMDWQMELPDGTLMLGNEVRIAVELELAQGS